MLPNAESFPIESFVKGYDPRSTAASVIATPISCCGHLRHFTFDTKRRHNFPAHKGKSALHFPPNIVANLNMSGASSGCPTPFPSILVTGPETRPSFNQQKTRTHTNSKKKHTQHKNSTTQSGWRHCAVILVWGEAQKVQEQRSLVSRLQPCFHHRPSYVQPLPGLLRASASSAESS